MGDRRYARWLAFAAGQKPKRYFKLLEEFGGDARAVFVAAAGGGIAERGPSDSGFLSVMRAKANEGYIDRCESYLEKQRMSAVIFEDPDYPALLREIYMPPPILFVKGRLPEEIALPIAVIGSRACSPYGKRAAEMISGELARSGVCVVSGMACGVDRAAARAALDNSGAPCPTVAVLGCGADIVYPPENRKLYDEICERGAVISEFQPGTRPEAFNFPRRNRVISGLSRGVVVVEAAIKSGTRITVEYALDQGRDVFAVPGRITDLSCEGTNDMIREGIAKPVFCARDILEEYGVEVKAAKSAKETDESALPLEQALIIRLLKAGERTVDELCEMTGQGPGVLNSILTQMELSGIIKQLPGRVYGL